jgi:hypothetical protein
MCLKMCKRDAKEFWKRGGLCSLRSIPSHAGGLILDEAKFFSWHWNNFVPAAEITYLRSSGTTGWSQKAHAQGGLTTSTARRLGLGHRPW